MLARTEADLEETARLSGRDDAVIVQCDVGKRAELGAAMSRAVEKLGRVDALVNNAGLAPLAAFETFGDEAIEEVLAVNLTAAAVASRAVWPVMQKQGGGVIVNIGSIAGIDPFEGLAV